MIYYKHYIGDFNRHTGHLSVAQDGAYRRLMDHYYSTECALPADKNSLYRICGAMEKYERAAVDFVCQQFFKELDGKLVHERIEEEIAIAQKKIEKLRANASAGGKQSGETRKEKAKANAEANASPNAKEDAQANVNKVNSHKSLNKKHSSDSDEPDPGFARFWETWPKTDRKTAKSECAKRWKARKLESVAEQILADVESRKSTRQWQEGYEPAPLTYINQRRWEDSSSAEQSPFA